jgi:protein arginine N-methyltransferase 1
MSGYDDSAIGSFDFHHSMLADSERTETFLRAILATVKPGDVVVDIGCGTGVLSLFAVMAGARTVYAIEREPIIEVASEIAEANGLGDRVRFISGSSTDIELPERVDVVISETVGNIGFDEGILPLAADARRRFAKPDARFIPQRVDVHASLVEVPHDIEIVERWSRPLFALDFSALRRLAVNNVMWADLSPVSLVSDRLAVLGSDIGGGGELGGTVDFTVRRQATVHGLGVWFSSVLAEGIVISNQPPNAVPSWEHGLMPLSKPISCAAGDVVTASIRATADGTRWEWVVRGQSMSTERGKLIQDVSD